MDRRDPRMVTLDALIACLRDRRPLDDVLERDPRFDALAPRDRALARTIATECCRRKGEIDGLIDACLARPLPAAATTARLILAMGAAQLLFLGFAAHAAVASSVALARIRAKPFASLVNAILRRLQREGGTGPRREAHVNTPPWLFESWAEAFGTRTAAAIAAVHLQRPPLDLQVAADAAGWARRLDARVLPTGGLRRESRGPVEDLPGFAAGGWWVQDAAAGLPARLLGEVAGLDAIDLCAAPGGKTAQLACAGARVTAVDSSRRRMARLRANLARLGIEARTALADAASWRPESPADAVLLDAPCSGTGTIRRNPDIAWTKTSADVARLGRLQARLIDNALTMLKPGGVLVATVCSLQPEEGEANFRRVMAERDDIVHLPLRPEEVAGLAEAIDRDGNLRTLPSMWSDEGGMDGFHALRLRRRS